MEKKIDSSFFFIFITLILNIVLFIFNSTKSAGIFNYFYAIQMVIILFITPNIKNIHKKNQNRNIVLLVIYFVATLFQLLYGIDIFKNNPTFYISFIVQTILIIFSLYTFIK